MSSIKLMHSYKLKFNLLKTHRSTSWFVKSAMLPWCWCCYYIIIIIFHVVVIPLCVGGAFQVFKFLIYINEYKLSS